MSLACLAMTQKPLAFIRGGLKTRPYNGVSQLNDHGKLENPAHGIRLRLYIYRKMCYAKKNRVYGADTI